MRIRTVAFALLATVLSGTRAQASTQFTFVNGGTSIAFGFNVGPYQATTGARPGTPVVLNCVDFFHEVVAGQSWFANIANVSSGVRGGRAVRASDMRAYRQSAWLTTHYAANPGELAGIQGTIWSRFSVSTVQPLATNAPFWLNSSLTLAGDVAPALYVVSDVIKADSNGVQEFIIYDRALEEQAVVPTPEPGSFILFGTALLGVAGFGRRRRR
ncbi:MAG: PEP-CTERM sorting domain-containing protein [bacterium]